MKVRSEFGRSVATLMLGTSLAQALPLASSPILTRIYTPEDFGILSLYLSITSIISVMATGRYEMAIMLPDDSSEVKAIVKLVMVMIAVCTVVSFGVVWVWNVEISEFLGNANIANWLFFVPVSIALTGVYQVCNYLTIREKLFSQLAKNKVASAVINTSTQLGMGMAINSVLGLILGNILGFMAAIGLLLRKKALVSYFKFRGVSVYDVAQKYKKFPIYDVPSVLVNIVANQLPIWALAKFFGVGVLGFYALMYKVLMVPIGLLSNSVLDVFKQRATEDYNRLGNCKDIYIKTLRHLVLIGFAPFLTLGLFAPDIFSFVFGEKWEVAGEFAQIMAPMFFLNFIVNPLSYTFFIAGKQHINLLGQTLLLALSALAIYLGIKTGSVKGIILFFSIAYSFIYVVYIVVAYNYAKGVGR